MNCPMTGKNCPNDKVFTISETIGEFTHTTKCCRSCAPDYVDLRNKAAGQQAASQTTQQESAAGLLPKMLGIDPGKLGQVSTNPIIIQKLGTLPLGEVQAQAPVQKIHPTKVCPGCNCTLGDIRKAKRLGCKQCYETFSEELAAYIPKAQGGKSQHKGKVPASQAEELVPEKKLSDKDEKLIAILREQMKQAISEEDYEKAAQCRDLIKKHGGTVEG